MGATRHTATIAWQRREDELFTDGRYSRAHRWRFDGGAEVQASSSPAVVRMPLSDPRAVDPEEAFVAALSSCHMLFFLDFAAACGLQVVSYVDHAWAEMRADDDGGRSIARVRLRPAITSDGPTRPADDTIAALHRRAHHACFLARSVRCEVEIEPQSGTDGETPT